MGRALAVAGLLAGAAGGLALYRWASHAIHGGETGLLVLALAAYLILLSGPLAHLLGLPVALVEILLGLAASWAGAGESEGLRLLSEIGANMVLFMAGAEIDVALLRRRARDALTLAMLVLAGPLLLSLLPLLRGDRVLIMAALLPTSVAITYAVLYPSGLARTRTGQTVLAAAMISDVLGMILLNMAGGGWSPLSSLYTIVILAALALYPVFPRLSEIGFEAEIRAIMMMVLVLGIASELIGIHSVLTSFILGLITGETVRSRRVLREKLEGMILGFFAPFFFLASGMAIEPSSLARALPAILLLGLLAYAAKALPALAYLRLSRRTPRRPALLYSASLAPLLTVTVIAAETGLRQGLISGETHTLLIGVVIVTTTLTGLVSKLSGRGIEMPEKHYH